MGSKPHQSDDLVAGTAERFRQRRELERAAIEAARKPREGGDSVPEDIGTRKLLFAAAIAVLLVGAGWYMLDQMLCSDRYSAISGFLFHECR